MRRVVGGTIRKVWATMSPQWQPAMAESDQRITTIVGPIAASALVTGPT